jgi:hypothetical protein
MSYLFQIYFFTFYQFLTNHDQIVNISDDNAMVDWKIIYKMLIDNKIR